MRKERYIVCAAVKTTDGIVHTGKRHCNCFALIGKLGGITYHHNSEQGFVDNKWDFVTREDAFLIAALSGQISRATFKRKDRALYSEDLY